MGPRVTQGKAQFLRTVVEGKISACVTTKTYFSSESKSIHMRHVIRNWLIRWFTSQTQQSNALPALYYGNKHTTGMLLSIVRYLASLHINLSATIHFRQIGERFHGLLHRKSELPKQLLKITCSSVVGCTHYIHRRCFLILWSFKRSICRPDWSVTKGSPTFVYGSCVCFALSVIKERQILAWGPGRFHLQRTRLDFAYSVNSAFEIFRWVPGRFFAGNSAAKQGQSVSCR